MNRIDRVTAILIQLQSRRVTRAQEIAERFDISLRTVYRDIRTLEEAGVPIVGEAGVGYSIMEGYRLPPVIFTKDEAISFLVAEKLIENYTDRASSETFRSAMFKIRSVLRTSDQEVLDELDASVKVLRSINHQDARRSDEGFQTILTGIHDRRVVAIEYKALYREETTTRRVEPIGTFLQNSHWYLVAYCRLKNDYRNFRLDRIERMQLTSETFEREHPPIEHYLQSLPDARERTRVRIAVEREFAKFLVTEKHYRGFVSEVERGDEIEMTFLVPSLHSFATWYLMLASHARILESDALRDEVRSILTEVAERIA